MASLTGIFRFSRSAEMRSVATYTFANFFNKGVSFLLLFYFTSVLTQADFGMLNLFSNSIIFLMPFISMGVLHSVNAEFFKKEKKEFSDFFSTTLLIPVVMTVVSIITMSFFRVQLKKEYAFPYTLLILVPVITLLNFVFEHFNNMARNNHEPTKYLIVNIGKLLIEIGLAVFFISALGFNWMGRVMGILIAYLLVAIYAWKYFTIHSYNTGSICKHYFKEEIKFSIPVISTQASMFFMSSSAGYFIQYFLHDYASVGVYSVAVTLSSVILVLSSALIQYFNPKVYSLMSQEKIDYNSMLRYFFSYAGAMLLGSILLLLFIPLVYNIALKSSYLPGIHYYYFICIGYFLWSLSIFFYPFMFYHKQKKKLLTVSMLSIAACVISQVYFIKNMGAYGAALSIFVVYLFSFLTTLVVLRKELAPLVSAFLSQKSNR